MGSEEESREYLQARLTTLWKVMFWAFVALSGSQLLLYEQFYPFLKPHYQNAIYLMATVGLVLMAFIWRGVLVRNQKLSVTTLYGIDTFYSAASGTTLGLSAPRNTSFDSSNLAGSPSQSTTTIWPGPSSLNRIRSDSESSISR